MSSVERALSESGYTIVRRIGSGGMGIVYLAEDAEGLDVALKLLRPEIADDPRARARLAREVHALQRLRSDNIAQPVDAELDGRGAFVVTEFIPGPTLDDAVRARGALHLEAVREIGVVLGETLEEIHAAGIVHRDLKPSNVMVRAARTSDLLEYSAEGDRLEPVIIDFGIAQAAEDSRLTSTGLMMGTAAYLDPEVVRSNSAGPETDWWAWAAVIAFCATGREPFGTGRPDVVFLRADRGDVDVDGLPAELAQWLRDALQPRLADRADPPELIHRLATLSLDPATIPMPGGGGAGSVAAGIAGAGAAAAAEAGVTTPVTTVLPHSDHDSPDGADGDGAHPVGGGAHSDGDGDHLYGDADAQPTTRLDPADLTDRDDHDDDDAGWSDAPRTELLPAYDEAQRTQVLPAYAEEANRTQVIPRVDPGYQHEQQPPGAAQHASYPTAGEPAPATPAAPAPLAEPQPFVAQDGRGHEFRQAEPAYTPAEQYPPQHFQPEPQPQHHGQPYGAPPAYTPDPYGQQHAVTPYAPSPYGMLPAAPPPPHRPFLVWLGIALLTGLGAIAPLMALILFVLLNALARTWQRTWLAQERSRARTGRASAAAAGAFAAPRFLAGLVESILLAIFPVLLAVLLVLAVDALAVFSGWRTAPAWYGGGAVLLTVLLCWVGLASRTTRAGAHRVMDSAAPDTMWTLILTFLLLALLLAVGITIAARGGAVDPFPIIGHIPVDQWIPWRQ